MTDNFPLIALFGSLVPSMIIHVHKLWLWPRPWTISNPLVIPGSRNRAIRLTNNSGWPQLNSSMRQLIKGTSGEQEVLAKD